jgi:hypothetical protein
MDTQTLLADMKARFAHNSAKHYLKEKYSSKLIIAEQNGLWKADLQTINFLKNTKTTKVILIDLYDNLVEVDTKELHAILLKTYTDVMQQWYDESKKLEKNR